MELSTVLELVKAGFTKDEITQMEQPQNPVSDPVPAEQPVNVPEQKAEPAVAPAPVAEPVAVAAPQPTPQPIQTPAQDQPTMADIMQGIAKLTSAVQANAIASSVIPQGLQNPPSAEDMIAEIIRPTFKERS